MNKTIQDLFRVSREDWLEEARDTARKLLRVRRTITIEDVLQKCPRPEYLHRNITGNVFSHMDFKSVGFATSRRTAMHGRVVRVWTLKQPSYTPKDKEYEYPDVG